jgi:tRNA A37 N6-isopentenylltransferase MiaA
VRSLAETIELVKSKTRQFAKRQLTWFCQQLTMEWWEVAPQEDPEAVVERMVHQHAHRHLSPPTGTP